LEDDVNPSYIGAGAPINSKCGLTAQKRVSGGAVATGMGEDHNIEDSTPAHLRERATRYRQMARSFSDQPAVDALLSLAAEYEAMAERMERIA
jgi:hypothetical protein